VLFEFTTDVTNDQSAEIERMSALLAGLSTDPRAGLAARPRRRRPGDPGTWNCWLAARPPGFFDPRNPGELPPQEPAAKEPAEQPEKEEQNRRTRTRRARRS
jgi:hypothetical protein